MKESAVTSFGGFHKVVEHHRAYMYRGVSNIKYQLIPKISREWVLGKDALIFSEKHMLVEP